MRSRTPSDSVMTAWLRKPTRGPEQRASGHGVAVRRRLLAFDRCADFETAKHHHHWGRPEPAEAKAGARRRWLSATNTPPRIGTLRRPSARVIRTAGGVIAAGLGFDDRGRRRSRTQRARRVAGEDNEIREVAPDQGEPAAKVRPSGFERETCGFFGHPAEGDLCCEQTATG